MTEKNGQVVDHTANMKTTTLRDTALSLLKHITTNPCLKQGLFPCLTVGLIFICTVKGRYGALSTPLVSSMLLDT